MQILQRIADVLVTTVKGSDNDTVKAAADRSAAQKLNNAALELHEALQAGNPADVAEQVEKVAKKLLKE